MARWRSLASGGGGISFPGICETVGFSTFAPGALPDPPWRTATFGGGVNPSLISIAGGLLRMEQPLAAIREPTLVSLRTENTPCKAFNIDMDVSMTISAIAMSATGRVGFGPFINIPTTGTLNGRGFWIGRQDIASGPATWSINDDLTGVVLAAGVLAPAAAAGDVITGRIVRAGPATLLRNGVIQGTAGGSSGSANLAGAIGASTAGSAQSSLIDWSDFVVEITG